MTIKGKINTLYKTDCGYIIKVGRKKYMVHPNNYTLLEYLYMKGTLFNVIYEFAITKQGLTVKNPIEGGLK